MFVSRIFQEVLWPEHILANNLSLISKVTRFSMNCLLNTNLTLVRERKKETRERNKRKQ